jgi:HK97 family phage prohead protease
MIFNRIHFPDGAPAGRKQYALDTKHAPLAETIVKGADTSTKYVFVLSSDTPDMAGDVISQDGWDYSRVRKSAPALWAHDASSFPIGSWTDLWLEGNKLLGAMQFAPTARAQQARALVESGHLKGVSVGFSVGKYSPRRGKTGGLHYEEGHTLLEASLCNIGCNGDALFRGVSKASDPKAKKVARQSDLKEVMAAQAAHDAKAKAVKAKPAPKPVISELEQARARRAERQRVAAMNPREHAEYLNAKLAKKEARRIELARLKGDA